MEYITPDDILIASENGICYETLYARVYTYGWRVARAATEPVTKADEEFTRWYKVAKENGISYQLFYDRVKRQKWSHEKAATEPKRTKEEQIRILNQHRKALLTDEEWKIAQSNGLSRGTVRARIKEYKWTTAKAITTPVKSKYHRNND